MYRPCAILAAVLCLVACSRRQVPVAPQDITTTKLLAPQESLCSSSLSVQQLLDNTNQLLQGIRVLYTENQLAGTKYGQAVIRDFNQVYGMVYERRFERLVEACRLAEATNDSLQQYFAEEN